MLTNLRRSYFDRQRKDFLEDLFKDKRNTEMLKLMAQGTRSSNLVVVAKDDHRGSVKLRQDSLYPKMRDPDPLKAKIERALSLQDYLCLAQHLNEYRELVTNLISQDDMNFVDILIDRIGALFEQKKLADDAGRDVMYHFIAILYTFCTNQMISEEQARKVFAFAQSLIRGSLNTNDVEMVHAVRDPNSDPDAGSIACGFPRRPCGGIRCPK